MKALRDYDALVARVDQRCRNIQARYREQIACTVGCRGNCCRIHLSVFAIEAFHLAGVLKAQPEESARQIRARARQTPVSGPCPLLEQGACRLYSDRLILCRTHGLPMRNRYRGRVSVGCCQKNFQGLSVIADDACIDLVRLNSRLAAVNQQFMAEYRGRHVLRQRYTIGEALLVFANAS